MKPLKNLETKIEPEYRMFFAGKERVFDHVKLTKSSIEQAWMISAAEYERLSPIVAFEICKDKSSLMLYEEFDFLREFFDLTQAEIALSLALDESTVSKWRKNPNPYLGKLESFYLKYEFEKRLKGLPVPQVATSLPLKKVQFVATNIYSSSSLETSRMYFYSKSGKSHSPTKYAFVMIEVESALENQSRTLDHWKFPFLKSNAGRG